jgi:hypothetical protein
MLDLLSHFKPGEIIGLVAVAGGLLVPLTVILGGFWHRGRLVALKRDMVNRGMTAEEIQSVLDAGSKLGRADRNRHSCRV